MMQYETILGQVVSKANNYQAVPDKEGGKRIIKSNAIRQYERAFLSQCKLYRNKNINRPFILHVDVFESSRVYDLDNALKTILDCLQYAKAISNDNLCIEIHAVKHLDRNNPRISYAIQELEPKIF